MVYSNKFVLCVLLHGQPQSELANGQVSIPFGCEYALRLRNKNNRRAVAKLYIDGENVSGGGYVVEAHDYIDIKRHHDKDRAFKFVSLDSGEAVDFGKDGPNHDKVKGTIEARFSLEKKQPEVLIRDVHHHHHHHHHNEWPTPNTYPTPHYGMNKGGGSGNYGESGSYTGDPAMTNDSCTLGGTSKAFSGQGMGQGMGRGKCMRRRGASAQSGLISSSPDLELNDGCTVEGYSTGQNFYKTNVYTEDQYTSLKIFLQGHGEEVVKITDCDCHISPGKGHTLDKGRKPAKDHVIDDLEAENERLRQELAELENERLKKELEARKNE